MVAEPKTQTGEARFYPPPPAIASAPVRFPPSMGRTVYYRIEAQGFCDGWRSAVVVYVEPWGRLTLNVACLPSDTLADAAPWIAQVYGIPEGEDVGCWKWPPFTSLRYR